MEIIYVENVNEIKDYRMDGFCVGWKNPLSETDLRKICENSQFCIFAIDMEKKRIVGIINALSDNVHWAFIPNLEVLPEYQKIGIGKELITKMLLMLEHLKNIDLICDENMQHFYSKFGMYKSHGMLLRKN